MTTDKSQRDDAATKLLDLIGEYWQLAYHEGMEGRVTDTESGAAQRAWHEINALVSRLAAQAAPALPAKWTAEEVERGHVGIRWVTLDGVCGRPTVDDLEAELVLARAREGHPVELRGERPAAAAKVETPEAHGQGWISVDERMPPKFEEVLIAFRDVSLPATGQYTASSHDTWGWCFPSENDPEDTGPITHWMPIPEHPAPPTLPTEAQKEMP